VLTGLDDLRVFYLFADEPSTYHKYAMSSIIPKGIDRKTALKRLLNP